MDIAGVSILLNTISFWTLTIGLVLYLIFLIIIAIIAPDVSFIKMKPTEFIIELFLVPTGACLPLLYFAYVRGLTMKKTLILFISFWIKLAVIHLLLEISGFYNWVFPDTK